jgi:hypothetical protein
MIVLIIIAAVVILLVSTSGTTATETVSVLSPGSPAVPPVGKEPEKPILQPATNGNVTPPQPVSTFWGGGTIGWKKSFFNEPVITIPPTDEKLNITQPPPDEVIYNLNKTFINY